MMKPYWLIILVCFMTMGLMAQQTNLLTNPGVETREQGFWTTFGAGAVWATDTAYGGEYSFKIVKEGTGASAGWMPTINNATLYDNRANTTHGTNKTWNLTYWAKTEVVNTDPANDDARIGVLFQFYDDGALVAEDFVTVDQTTANTSWTQYAGGAFYSGAPDSIWIVMSSPMWISSFVLRVKTNMPHSFVPFRALVPCQ